MSTLDEILIVLVHYSHWTFAAKILPLNLNYSTACLVWDGACFYRKCDITNSQNLTNSCIISSNFCKLILTHDVMQALSRSLCEQVQTKCKAVDIVLLDQIRIRLFHSIHCKLNLHLRNKCAINTFSSHQAKNSTLKYALITVNWIVSNVKNQVEKKICTLTRSLKVLCF